MIGWTSFGSKVTRMIIGLFTWVVMGHSLLSTPTYFGKYKEREGQGRVGGGNKNNNQTKEIESKKNKLT